MASSVPLSVQSLFNVDGLVAVFTGGGSGLGSYAARALDANGARVVYIVGRREESLKEVAKSAVNGNIKPLVGDISSKESLAAIAETVRKEQGYINLLYANAGVTGPHFQSSTLTARNQITSRTSLTPCGSQVWTSSRLRST